MDNDIYASLGRFLRQFRIEAGLTQEEAGAKLGIDRSTLASFENGRRRPSVEFLLLAEKVYKADVIGELRKLV